MRTQAGSLVSKQEIQHDKFVHALQCVHTKGIIRIVCSSMAPVIVGFKLRMLQANRFVAEKLPREITIEGVRNSEIPSGGA